MRVSIYVAKVSEMYVKLLSEVKKYSGIRGCTKNHGSKRYCIRPLPWKYGRSQQRKRYGTVVYYRRNA